MRHYLLRAVGGELSDADIEVTEVAWVPLPDIRTQLAYPDERGLVDTAGRLLAEIRLSSAVRRALALLAAAAATLRADPGRPPPAPTAPSTRTASS